MSASGHYPLAGGLSDLAGDALVAEEIGCVASNLEV
jgi:hypothetical protein